MWRVVLRSHQRHLLRLLLVCVAIAVGVAFLSGTFILTNTDQAAIASTAEQAYGGVAVAVQGTLSSSHLPGLAGYTPVPDGLVATVRGVPGVAQAQGEVDGYAQLVGRHGALVGAATSATRGISVGPVAALTPFVVQQGRPPATAGQVDVDAHTFATQHLHLGQRVPVVTQQPAAPFTVVGVIESRQSSDVLGATLVGFTGAEAQHVLGQPGQVSVVLATATPGTSPAQLRARVARAVGPGFMVVSGPSFIAETAQFAATGAPTFSTVLDVVLGIALLVAIMVIFNIITMLVGQRRRELALLRCLGASPAQLARAVLGEALVLGFVASAIGLGLGIAAAAVLLHQVTTSPGAQTSAAGLDISFSTVVLSLAVGTAVTALASVLPALTASRIPPVGALGVDAVGEVEGAAPARRSSGLWLMVAGLPVASVGLFVGQGDRVEIWLVGGGMLLTLAGLGRLSPLLVPPMISLLGWPLPRVAGLAGSLGRQNATRNARRTVVTASALLIGVTLVSLLAIIETSARASSDRALGQAITANYQVSQAGSPPLTDGPSHATALSPLVLTRLDARPDLATSPFRFVSFLLDGRANFGGAVDPATITRMISFGHVQGSLAALAQGGLAASVQQASAMDLHVGEVVRVTLFNQLGHGASTDLRVDAIYQRGDIALSGYLFSTATATRIDPSLALNAVFVRARAGVPERVVAHQVGRAVAGFSDVTVRDVAQLQAAVDQSIASEINLISVLLVLAVAVAVLGIVNALALSVVERTRELALLRAVGMSRAQIRSMVRSEAALIGTVGALLGVLLGLFLGWAFQRALRTQGVTELVVPWLRLVVYVAAGAVTGVIAGTLPARRAAQVDMLAAIASE